VPTLPTTRVPETDLKLEIAHLLLIDIVGYSKQLVNEQIESLQELGRVVRNTECFRRAEASGKLIRVPTGDGMALLFFQSPEEPVRCALEISQKLRETANLQVRMGIHSGPVNQVRDVNDTINVAGTGINVAQRVMDCGDAGHILLSKHVAEDLAQYRHWQPYLHDLGECEVKHGLRLHIVNLYKDGLGNPAMPEKLRRRNRWKQNVRTAVRPVGVPRSPISLLMVLVALTLGTLAVSVSIFLRRGTTATLTDSNAIASIPAKSIAVLPFENLSDEKQNSYFTGGVQDEILTDLAKVADLKVISRTSVMQYKSGTPRNLREIARQLGVAHILEGSVQRAGDRVRINAQLIDARTDTHLWAEHYERDLADIFAVESEVSEKIVSQLKSKLSPDEKAAIEKPVTADRIAYDFYLRAKDLTDNSNFTGGRGKLLEAEGLLKSAVQRDPNFFRAYCRLAAVHDQLYLTGLDHTAERLALAQDAIDAAVRLQPESGEVNLIQAQHRYWGYFDYDEALEKLKRAQHLLPNESNVFILAAFIDRRRGLWDESMRNFNRALDVDPRNTLLLQQIAISYSYQRRHADAANLLDRALGIAPNSTDVRVQRANIDIDWRADTKPLHDAIQSIIASDPTAASGLADDWLWLALLEHDPSDATRALAVMTSAGMRNISFTFPRSWCEGIVARERGDGAGARRAFLAAREEVETLVRKQPDYGEPLCVLGMIDAVLGRKEDAIREVDRAFELVPATKDYMNNALLQEYRAAAYSWVGEKDRALAQLQSLISRPSPVSYGDLRLDPYWKALRGDPRFEKILASLAPK
jgi:TolB-like protein/Flp pilus assembly protein TadD